MHNFILVAFGKLIVYASRLLNLGHGSTWPGHIALNINKNFIKDILHGNLHLKIILIAGTNGKTTTGKLIQTILEKSGKKVFQNESGANLLNGIASSILLRSSILCKIYYDFAIFEVDENTLPLALKEFSPYYLILLNLFRDQLDRYGEVNTIASKWKKALEKLPAKTQLILNADDPQITYLGIRKEQFSAGVNTNPPQGCTLYFGLKDKKIAQTKHQHAADSTYCPNCGSKLTYSVTYYSHLGDWRCKNCGYKRSRDVFSTPLTNELTGTYNLYNILAATLVTKKIGISDEVIKKSLKTFTPAFGRQEMLKVDGKKAQIFLSKNPTSFNESLRTIASLKAKNVLFVLNDRIPDGRDVSWIWDVDFEDYIDKFKNMIVSGDRAYDTALRIKYATQNSIPDSIGDKSQNYNSKLKIYQELKDAIDESLKLTNKNEVLYILPTYSAMLEVRKILTGKKIL